MQIYVNVNSRPGGDGSKDYPFQKIQMAANIAKAGDEILVFPGVYRENVNPINAGTKDAPIVYKSVEKRQAVITGAEPISNWIDLGNGVWQTTIGNTRVRGDWFYDNMIAHTGEVYLNDKSMYEVTSLEEVQNPKICVDSWDQAFSIYKWYAQVSDETTTFYGYFGDMNPNEEKVEISVRRQCYYPQEEGVNYITLSGFTVQKAATQWAPPTAYQEGMIGPHWSKGWIIEDCDISESKCCGISLGKYLQPENDNKWLKWKYKDGTQTERDCICQAQREGWTKERIGHHIIRRCEIHDCGQTGIVGHLGGVFSLIEDNHIYNINNKQNLGGAEIGGIKMHAAIDVIFRRNVIHHCTRGIWLDWQAQGTRVTQNLFFDNTLPEIDPDAPLRGDMFASLGEDVFIEVSHGPTLLDNNIFLSERAVKVATQGVALVHNIIGGSLVAVGIGTDNGSPNIVSPRYTPYHVPHQTEIAGFMTFLHGDMRFYNNIFIQPEIKPILRKLEGLMSGDGNKWDDGCMTAGTFKYNGYQTFEEWDQMFEGYCGMGSPASDRYYLPLPVWSKNNMYFNGATPWEKEINPKVDTTNQIYIKAVQTADGYGIDTNLYDYVKDAYCDIISTNTLGMAFEPEQRFENPDGTEIIFNEDYNGKHRGLKTIPGPLA